jgi:hypothetical protein
VTDLEARRPEPAPLEGENYSWLIATGPYYSPSLHGEIPPGHAACDVTEHAFHGRHYHCANCLGATGYQGRCRWRPAPV